jgi:hypothetical protein
MSGSTLRRLARRATSRTYRRWAANIAAALLVLFPVLVVSLDHHGAERIATHQHLSDSAEVPPHVHGFEMAHLHGPAAVPASSTMPAIAAPEPVALMVISLAQDATVRLQAVTAPGDAQPYWNTLLDPLLRAQTALTPPTPPPDVRAARSGSTRMAA